ncbi:hypothetical protein REPUB_Repub20aG0129600 [Reevesia pubescens]
MASHHRVLNQNDLDHLARGAAEDFRMLDEIYGRPPPGRRAHGPVREAPPQSPYEGPYQQPWKGYENKVDYLQQIGLDGFAIIEQQYGQGSQRQTPPLPRGRQDQYHNQRLTPNQYYYQEPDYARAKEHASAFRAYRSPQPSPTKQSYETWYFLPVSHAPKQEAGTHVISSSQAAELYGGILSMDYGYKTKPYR